MSHFMNGSSARGLVALVATIAAIAVPPLSADTIVLISGTRVSGQVKVCDDEVCVADSTRVPRAGIAAILLGDAKLPESASAGSVILKDGTVRRGHFDSLTLGFATLDKNDIDRANVAAIIVADIIPPKHDTIVLRDGTSRTGNITTCNAASCTIDGSIVPREQTRWIGLAQDGAPPAEPTEDTIFLSNRTTMRARLSSLDASLAQTTHGHVARAEVTWVYVADTPTEAQKPTAGATETPAPAPPPPQRSPLPPAPPGRSTNPQRQPPPSIRSDCHPGQLWVGKIKAHSWGSGSSTRFDQKIDADVRAQETICDFYKAGDKKPFAASSYFDTSGSTVHNTWIETGNGSDCRAEGSAPAKAESNTMIWRNFSATASPWAFDVPKGRALYNFWLETPVTSEMPMMCSNNRPNTMVVFPPPFVGRSPLGPLEGWTDPELRYLQDGKMIGSAFAPAHDPHGKVAFSWAICPVGMDCQLPPLPDEGAGAPQATTDNDPCGELKSLIEHMKQLGETYKEYERDYKEAVEKRDGIRDRIWGGDGALRKFFTALGELAGTAAGEGANALKRLLKITTAAASEKFDDVRKAAGFERGTLLEIAKEKGIEAATQNADKVLEATGSDSAALRVYADSLERSEDLAKIGETVHKTVEIATNIKEYWKTTTELADLIQEWLEENENANIQQEQMNDIQKQMDEIQTKITDARNRLTAPCPETGMRRDRSPEYVPASLHIDAAADPAPNPNANAVAKLKDIRSHLDQARTHIVGSAEWLLPFIFEVKMSPRLQKALLAKAQPELSAAVQNIDAAVQESASMQEDVRAIVAPKSPPTPAPGPGSHPSSFR